MPAYNVEKYVSEAIDSILAQDYPHWELLVADDASTDNTRQLIDTYTDRRIRRIHQDTNLGYLQTCNKLFAAAQGDFITFQDADDYAAPTRFSLQIAAFAEDETLSACGTNFFRINEQGKPLSCSCYEQDYQTIKQNINDFPFLCGSVMLKKQVYQDIGGYHPYFDRIGSEDYYWMWLILEKYKFINLKPCLYYYRYNPESVSGNLSNNYRKMFSADTARFLIAQRQASGTDSLTEGNPKALADFVAQKAKPYQQDRSLLDRTLAKRYYWNWRPERAWESTKKALKKEPLKKENLLLAYTLLKDKVKSALPKKWRRILKKVKAKK